MTIDSVSALDTSTPMDVSASLAASVVLVVGDPTSLVVDLAPLVLDFALLQASASVP